MKNIIFVAALTLLCALGWAALSDYSFQQSAGTYTELTAPTQIHGPGVDDSMSSVIELGFTFMFDENPYTQFKANSNGFITLNPSSTASLSNNLTTQTLILGALWDDLKTNDGDGQVGYQLSGTSPNQVLTVQFKSMKWYYSTTNLVNFQIKLYQGSNRIEFIYGTMAGTPGTSASASIGLSGAVAGNFLSVTPASPSATYSTTAEFNQINGTHIPFLTGNMYVFLPPVPADNDLAATGISGNLTPSVNTPSNYTVSIYNRGSNAQSTYTVQLIDASDNVLASVAGPAIASGATTPVQVAWTPTAQGPVALRGRVVLTGDENPANNTTSVLNVTVMPAGVIVVTIGDGSANIRMPLDFYYRNSLNETLYFPTEIGMYGNVTAITLYNNFSTATLNNMPTKIWLGTTNLADLSGGWIPATELTQVFDGTVTYPPGENTITIPLQTIFPYTSGNLVVMFNRPMDTGYYSSLDYFKGQTIGTNRARNAYSDSVNYDPTNPGTVGTVSGTFAKTSLHMTPLGDDPYFSVIPASRDYGTVLINSSTDQTFSIMNAGGGTLVINSIAIAGSQFFSLQNLPTLPVSLTTGQTATFIGRYQPTAEGAHSATITITDNLANRVPHTVSLIGNCIDTQITALPYTQNFDAVTAPALPLDWGSLITVNGTTAVVVTYTSSPHSAPNSVRMYNGATAGNEVFLIAPPLAPAIPVNSVRLKLWVKGGGSNYTMSFGVMTDPTDASTFTQVGTITPTTAWLEYVVPFNGYTGTGTFMAIKHDTAGTGRTFYVDDVILELIAADDLACTALTGNTTPAVNAATTYTASVFNWGTNPQSAYSVKLYSSDGTELATAAGVACAPGATVQIPVVWTPTVEGPLAIYAKVILPGDQNPANDQSPVLNIAVQPAGVLMVTIGEGNLAEGVPLEFYYKNSLHQALYFQSELNVYGNVTALTFYNNFVTNLPNMPCKFWLAQTDLADLSGGWILDGLTLVYDGNIDFPSGQNTITIPLQTPFSYTAGNLLLYAQRPMDTVYYSSSDNFQAQTLGTNRARKLISDSVAYDPLAPSAAGTLSGTFAKTSFSFVTSGFAALQGVVTSGGNPVADVSIVVDGTTYSTVTAFNGAYSFPFLQPGNYTVTASKLGYETQNLPVVLVADETTTLNFILTPSVTVNVSGTVVGSDQPTVGLAGVEITLDGPLDYTGTTNALGQFMISGVLSGNNYNYSFVKTGYQDLSGTISVGGSNHDMGTLTMNEIALPPAGVEAVENLAQTQVSLTWYTPGSTGGPFSDFELDDGGWVSSGFGDWEWGNDYNVANYVDIDTYVDQPPASAHSGTGMWGTVLEGGYSNCGDWSYLRKTFNFSGINNPVLSFWHYMDGYNTWDYGLIKVNGATVWGSSSQAVFMPWQELTVNLAAYANQATVEISFEWYATTVVSYAGWYIDDLYVGPSRGRTVNYAHSEAPAVTPGLSETAGAALRERRDLSPGRLIPSRDAATRQPRTERILTGYRVWRLLQGNEGNEGSWVQLTPAAIADTAFVDTGWAALPDGNYKWAVKAIYTNNVPSVAAFSNLIRILRLDLAALSLSGTTTPSVNLPATYQVEVQNTGTTTQQGTAYTVKLMAGTTELASVPGVTLTPGQTHTFSIVWTPSTPGPLALTGRVALPGDALPANDSTQPLNISVMPEGVVAVTVGDGTAVEGRPVDFYYNNSLFQCLYYPSELEMFGSITALSFYNNFVTNLPNKPTKIWLGQTSLPDLSGGWILPPGNLTLVYDGNITYPSGENTVTIPLQTPFEYTSGNLVLYANRPMDTQNFNTGDDFRVQTVGANRARKLTSNTVNYDPNAPSAAGTLSGQFPMTTFHLAAIGSTPIFAITPTSRDFGTVLINNAFQQQFIISNAGGGPLTVSSISIAGSPFFTLAGLPGFPATIAFGETITFTANYLPTAEGPHAATITIVDNMARQTHTVSLAGNCIDTQINSLPYAQSFDGVAPPALPIDWNSIVQSTSTSAFVGTYASTTYAHSQPNCARLYNPSD
ncbi:MAG: choice-of-anchor D domain-containing protein, partial [Candidatus Syntrophosphaera sp.]|nr:choice-of-anchor D domain-containing protein [Candidatus Syntrophosphaera sp.]